MVGRIKWIGVLGLGCVGGLLSVAHAASYSAASPAWVYTPPRRLALNFWVPGTHSSNDFTVNLNGQPAAFRVPAQSMVVVGSDAPFAPGTYTLSGTLRLPTSPMAVFPATTTVTVRPSPSSAWMVRALGAQSATVLSALNAYRKAAGLPSVIWSAGLQLAAWHHQAYLNGHPNQAPSPNEMPGKPGYTGETPLARATHAGYLGPYVSEWDGAAAVLNPLAAVIGLINGPQRAFLINPALTRLGLAVTPRSFPVLDGGVVEPNPLMAQMLAYPGPGMHDVPTAGEPGSPAVREGASLTGYPVSLELQGWNILGPFHVTLTTRGEQVAGRLVSSQHAGQVTWIPAHPLPPGRRYLVTASVEAANPLTAAASTKTLTYGFHTVPAGLILSPVGQGPRLRVGHTLLLQLSSTTADGLPAHVGQAIRWQVGSGLRLAAFTRRVAANGLAMALVIGEHVTESRLRASVGSQQTNLPLSVTSSVAASLSAVPEATRVTGPNRVAIVAKMAQQAALVAAQPPTTAILLAQNPAAAMETAVLAPLSRMWNAPLFLTKSGSSLGIYTRAGLSALDIRHVILLGASPKLAATLPPGINVEQSIVPSGPVSLAAWVASQLKMAPHPYHQALVVANRTADWSDAIVAAPVAATDGVPIVLLNAQGQVPAAESAAMAPVRQSFVIGAAARLHPALPGAMDLAGRTRFDTSVLVAHEFYANRLPGVVLASGEPGHAVPALTAGLLAANLKMPIVLTPNHGPTLTEAAWLSQVRWSASPSVFVIGGSQAVSTGTVERIRGLLASPPG